MITIHHHLESVAEAEFWLAFVTRKSEVERLAPLIAKRAKGDAIVWFAYPKGTSKKYTCDFNRDTGWTSLMKLGFDTRAGRGHRRGLDGAALPAEEFIKSESG